jgi:Leucine Rich repeat
VTVKPKPVSRPWWNYVRFSLRALIVLVLLIGAGLGWLVRSAHVQRDAVAAIRRAGGGVTYDWEWNSGKCATGGEPWAPKWLVGLIGVDYFAHVTSVWLLPVPTDGTIVEVGHLTQLERLQLIGGIASDGGLIHLKGLTKLSGLSLSNNQVSDAGLVHLNGLTKLSDLDHSYNQVSDAGLVHLKGLTKLSVLDLERTQITDAGLAHLNGLSELRNIGLTGTRVTQSGVQELQKELPNAQILP